MNRFRANLHPALFEKVEAYVYDKVDRSVDSSELNSYQNELKILDKEVIDNFSVSVGSLSCVRELMSEERGKYRNQFEYETAKEDFQLRSKEPEGKTTKERRKERKAMKESQRKDLENGYEKIWDQRSKEGFWHLISALREKGYIKKEGDEGYNKGENAKRINEIKELYRQEVKSQLLDNVWYSSDKKFDSIKDILFSRDSADYPANKVYCKLVPEAKSIFGVERRARKSTIDATALKGKEYNETTTDRQDRKFLSNDLPEYLWSIRKTPWILKALSWLPVFGLREDRPSLVDRDAIDDFLKVTSRLSLKKGSRYEKEKKDVAVALFEMFEKNNDLNVNDPSKYKAKLEEFWIEFEEKDFDDILRVWAFYISTQAEWLKAEDQHPIYLSVLEIVRQKGSVKNAIKDLKNLVEEAKKTQKDEKKEWFKSGDVLGEKQAKEYRDLAQKLGISDLTSATRLRNLAKNKNSDNATEKQKAENHFKQEKSKILADLNNDGIINPNDIAKWWTNTWMQFLEMCKLIWEDEVLDNLIERAKLQNTLLNLWLEDEIISVDSISNWNPGVILLLQDIIAKPGQDLYSLLSWETTAEIVENDKKIMDECKQYANRFLKDGKINNKGVRERLEEQSKLNDNDKLDGYANFADLQASMATFLYDNYKLWVWVWSTISFDRWARWLKIWTGVQLRDKWKAVLWLSVTYDHTYDLGKGWSLTPALNAWAFLPIASWDKTKIWTSIWTSLTLDKEKLDFHNHTTRHYWLEWWVSLVGTGVVVYGWLYNRENRAENIDTFSEVESTKFTQNTMRWIIDEIAKTLWEDGLKLSGDDNNIENIKAIIDRKIKNVEEDKEVLKANIIRMLAKYDGIQLTPENKEIILSWIRVDYERLRAESHKAEISKWAYFSWYSAWVYGGDRGIGVYVAWEVTKHDSDAYGYRNWRIHNLDNWEHEVFDEDMIASLNERLGLKTDAEQLKFEEDYIRIPKAITYMVKVTQGMDGLMAKDENGDVLISKRSTLHEHIKFEQSTKIVELHIWEWEESDFRYHLDAINQNRFWKDMEEIDSKILKERNKLHYTEENFIMKLGELKVGNTPCIPQEQRKEIAILIRLQGNLNAADTDQKLKITIERELKGGYKVDVKENGLWSGFEIEYMEQKELFDSNAKQMAQEVYNWAAGLKDPTALYRVKHPHPGTEDYRNFAISLQEGNFGDAKGYLENIKTKLPWFPEIQRPSDNEALWQLLMSINNIFARANNVIWRWSTKTDDVVINNYEIRGETLWSIIERRSRQIKNTISKNSKIDTNTKDAYAACIDAMEKAKNSDKWYNESGAQSASLNNTVWFNLWDYTDPENPLLGVEVYDKVYEANALDQYAKFGEHREKLHEHVMKKFIWNEALFKAVWETIWKTHREIEEALANAKFQLNWNTWELRLDFKDKNYIVLSADMKLGYYTQCVNHTVILDNISVNASGNKIPYVSQSWENGQIQSTSVDNILATTTYSGGIAITASTGGEKDNTAVASNSADDWGLQIHTGDNLPKDPDVDPDVNNDGGKTDSWGDEA